MINVILCDDDPKDLEYYKCLINKLSHKHHVSVSLKTYTSGESLGFSLEEQPYQPDIIFLDILMNGMDGIKTGEFLRSCGCDSLLVFLTWTKEFAWKTFQVKPFDYFVKGEDSLSRFEDILLSAIEKIQKRKDAFLFYKSNHTLNRLCLQDVLYFESSNHQIITHCKNEVSKKFYMPIKKLSEKLLSLSLANFARVHSSYLVNLDYVSTLESNRIVLRNGTEIPVSRRYFANTYHRIFDLFHS